MNKKIIILLTIFIDVLGIGIIIPVLPFYVQSFGTSSFTVTLLFAVFSFFSFFSAPFLGALSDRIGRRPVLIISILSTAVGWSIFAAASSVIWLFVGRIIDGAAAGNFPIAQSYLLDIAKDDKEKTSNLGLIGAIFGLGFIIGPLIGGFLSAVSLDFPFWFVGALAALNFFLAIFNLPETNKNKSVGKKIELNPFRPLWHSLKNKKLRPGFIAWFLFGLAIASQQSTFSLYLGQEFGFTATATGFVMAGMGLILVLNQGFALKKVWLKYFKEEALTVWLTLLLTVGFFLMGFSFIYIFLLGVFLMSVAQSVLRAVMTSQVVKKGAVNSQGAVLGVLNSVMSLSMIIGPLIAGWLFGLKANFPFLASGFLGLIIFIILMIDNKRKQSLAAALSDDELVLEEQKMELA